MYVTLVPLLTAMMTLIVQMTPVMQLTVVAPPTHQMTLYVMTTVHARPTFVIKLVRELVARTLRMTLHVMTAMAVPTRFVMLQVPWGQVAWSQTTLMPAMTVSSVH
jgi:hypothetical protein